MFDFVQRIRVERDPAWLAAVLAEAAQGRFPPPDGSVSLVGPVAGAQAAVLAFTGFHVIASPLPPDQVAEGLRDRGVSAPMEPRFLSWLAGEIGGDGFDAVDIVLASTGIPASGQAMFVPTEAEIDRDPRLVFAVASRRQVRIWRGHEGGVVVLGRGLADRLEISMELPDSARGGEEVDCLLEVALANVGCDEPVYAQVSARNSLALRASLSRGFRPLCAEAMLR